MVKTAPFSFGLEIAVGKRLCLLHGKVGVGSICRFTWQIVVAHLHFGDFIYEPFGCLKWMPVCNLAKCRTGGTSRHLMVDCWFGCKGMMLREQFW